MSNGNQQLEIIDQIYAAAIEPERFDELVDTWQEKLTASDTSGFQIYSGELERLYSHVDQADTILSLVTENPSDQPTPLFAKINSDPRPTLVIDENRKIHASNDAAQSRLALLPGQNLSDWLSDPVALAELSKLMKSLLSDNENLVPAVPRLLRLWAEQDSRPLLFSLVPWTTASGRNFILLQASNFLWPDHLNPIIANAFELTKAETDIVKLLVEGASVQDVSAIRRSSISTVRSQIKSIYAKMGTKNQSEFLRMVLGLATLNLRDPKTVSGAFEKLPRVSEKAWPLPEHERLMSLSDGRILEYTDCGPAEGLPCIYFHDESFGNIWPSAIAAATLEEGYRIITPSRPYYGRSSPYPDRAITYEQVASDLKELLDHLQLERVLLISITSGMTFALSFADSFPEHCSGYVALAPAFSVETAEEEANMPKFCRFLNNVSVRHPRLLNTFLKLGMAYHNRVGSIRYLKRVMGGIPADIDVIRDDANLDAMVRALEFTGAHGHLGTLHDFRSLLPDSTRILKELPFPVFALIGNADRNSREMRADRLVLQGVEIQKVIARGGGTMLHFTHPDLVIQAMRDAWDRAASLAL